MKSYRFEVVRRRYDRFGWNVVAIDGARRRVLARSERTWRSPKRAKRAIAAVQGADVVDVSNGPGGDGGRLPTTTFGVVPGVLPLIVAERPDDYEIAPRPRVYARGDAAQSQAEHQQQAAQEGPEAQEDPAGKRGIGRRSKKAD